MLNELVNYGIIEKSFIRPAREDLLSFGSLAVLFCVIIKVVEV